MAIRHLNRFEYSPGGSPIARKLRRYPVKSSDGTQTIRKLARGLNSTLHGGSGSGPFCCPCLHCYLGTTPRTWTITATGITLITSDPCCINFFPMNRAPCATITTSPWGGPTLSWNGTFTLDTYAEGTQLGCDCQWTSAYRDNVTFNYGDCAGCPGCPGVFTTSSAFRWLLSRDSTSWFLAAYADQAVHINITIPIFFSTLAVDSKNGDCESALTFTNQALAVCSGTPPCNDNVGLSSTGTVVATPHP